jgi:M6 family metalloprotease-like protein
VNYADYDNWTFTPYNPNGHHPGPDGNVDLIIMLYRNIKYPGGYGGMNGSGIATLGFVSDLSLDGKTIKFGFPGSGITNGGGYMAQVGGSVMDGVLGSVKHEIGHLLFGAGHPQYTNNYYTPFTVWGIMGNFATNAWERERMGWISFDNVTENQTSSLADFVKTGHAYRIVVPNTGGNQAFIVENHQNLSVFDTPNRERPSKGLFILHVFGSDVWHPLYDIEVAEGKFNWANPYWTMPTFYGDSLPVFA